MTGKQQTIGIFARICHAEKTLLGMLQLEILVLKLVPIDRFSTCTVSFGEIPTLDHELLDDPMKSGTFISEPLFSSCKGTKVLCGLRTSLVHDSIQPMGQEQTFGTVLP